MDLLLKKKKKGTKFCNLEEFIKTLKPTYRQVNSGILKVCTSQPGTGISMDPMRLIKM
jgi:hypothetical protein